VPDETVKQCNRSYPKQTSQIGAACTLCIAVSRSPCRRYQGRAICPFGGAGYRLQPHRHLSMTMPRLHQLARRSPLAARVHLLQPQCQSTTMRCIARSLEDCIRPTYSAWEMSSTVCPLPVHGVHVRHHSDPNTTLYLLHQSSSNDPRPNQTKPYQTTRSAQGALLHLSPESSGDVAVHTLLEKSETTPPVGSGPLQSNSVSGNPPRSSVRLLEDF
jgi:hypothetical protein